MKKIFFAIIAITLAMLPARAQKVFNSAKMDSLIHVLEQHDKAMGTLTLARNGKAFYKKAFGYKQLSGKIKNETDTKYRIGSVTKMFTATMILQLIEEGKLTLETKLGAYYPDIPNANDITIEQLLTHHSGLYNFTDGEYLKFHTKPKTQQEILDIIAKQTPDFKPGERAGYSNTNYMLLGYIIEKLTGKSYSENLRLRIAGKTGLKNTYVGSKINPKNNEAYSYSFNGFNWIVEDETDMSLPGGAGALVSNTADLIKFIDALFSTKLVSETSLSRMATIKDGYGMGIFQAPFYDKKGYTHNGGIDGFSSSLVYFPDDKLEVALLMNGLTYQMNDIMIGILSIYYDKNYAIPEFKKPVQLPESSLGRYEGIYSSREFPLKITIARQGQKLTAQATGQDAFPLAAISETEFRFDTAGIVILFTIEADATVKKLTLQQMGSSYHFEKE